MNAKLATHTFSAEVIHPETEALIDCEVEYFGVREITLLSVKTEAGEDLLDRIPDWKREAIEEEARTRAQDELDVARFGCEVV